MHGEEAYSIKVSKLSWIWWCAPGIPESGRSGQRYLGYHGLTVRSCQKHFFLVLFCLRSKCFSCFSISVIRHHDL